MMIPAPALNRWAYTRTLQVTRLNALIGLNALWMIAVTAVDARVAAAAAQFLVTLQLRVQVCILCLC
jgi:hypothetical protein